MIRRPPRSTLFPSTPLFRPQMRRRRMESVRAIAAPPNTSHSSVTRSASVTDGKSTRLNSSHLVISYAVFCLKKKKKKRKNKLKEDKRIVSYKNNNVKWEASA